MCNKGQEKQTFTNFEIEDKIGKILQHLKVYKAQIYSTDFSLQKL